MLINFRCGNFRSLRDETTLSMLKGESRSHPTHVYKMGDLGLLKMAVIFGPNASGKSNVFNAINFSRNIILKQPERMYNSYYRLEPEYEERPTLFEYEMTIKGVPYRYGFEIILNEDKVIGEWLYRISLESEEDQLLFRRVDDSMTDGAISKNEKEVINKNIKKYGKILALTLCDLFRDNKKGYCIIEESCKVLDWFINDLIIIGVRGSLRTDCVYDKSDLEEMSKILRAFDVGINEVDFVDWQDDLWVNAGHSFGEQKKAHGLIFTDFNTEKWEGKKKLMLASKHGNNKTVMPRVDESDGTRRLLDLAPILMEDATDRTYVVDELDRSLHPLVVYEFVKWFLDGNYSQPKQLITTTHQILLMDQELLRKDEIWFVEKKADGHSELFSLDEYNERSDRKIDKSYLEGKYGAIPKVDLRRE